MNLKKAGQRILLITLVLIVLLNFLPIDYRVRLFLGAFGFGSGLVLVSIGGKDKYKF